MAYSYDGYLRFNTEVDESGFKKGLDRMQAGSVAGGIAIEKVFEKIGGTILNAGKFALMVGSDFEEGMSKVQSISNASADDMERLSAKAKEMGAATKFSATESAEALSYMAMAGWKTEQMLEGLPGIMNLAAASGENLGMVSDIVTDALTAFGMKAEESGRFADVLASASSNANTNVGLMGATFKYVAPIAGALGYTVEDTATAIGLMANAGIKGEMAGTQLRNIMTSLAGPTGESAKAFEELGVSIKSEDGTMKSFREVLTDLRGGMADLDEAQKANYASSIAGKQGMSGLLSIVNAGEEDFNKLADAVDHSAGSAEAMANIAIDNLKGDLTILGSTAESVGIQIYEALQVKLRNVAQTATKLLGDVGGTIQFVVTHGKELVPVLTGITTALVTLKGASEAVKVIDRVKKVSDGLKLLGAGVNASTAMFARLNNTLKAHEVLAGVLTGKITLQAGATMLATKAQLAFNAAFVASPIGPMILVIGALAGATAYAVSKQKEANKELENSLQPTRDATRAWQDLKQSHLDSASAKISELENTKAMIEELGRLTDAEGNVGDNKARVQYLTEKINEALPESVTWTNEDTIAINGNISALTDQIKLKEAIALLEEAEIEASEARKARQESLNRQIEAGNSIAEDNMRIEQLRTEMGKANSDVRLTSLANEIAEIERGKQKKQEALDEEVATFKSYNESIDYAGKLSIAVTEKNNEEVVRLMSEKELAIKDIRDLSTEEAIEQYNRLKEKDELLFELMKTDNSKAVKDMYDANHKAMEDMEKGLEARAVTEPALYEEIGTNNTLGFARGLLNPGALALVRDNSAQVANLSVRTAKTVLDQHSPSKVMQEVGEFYTEGLALGIIKNKDSVLKSVTDLSLSAIDKARQQGKSYKEIGSLYLKSMKEGITEQSETVIKQMESLVEKQVEAQVEKLDKKNPKARSAYQKSANELMKTYREALKKGAEEANRVLQEKIQGITDSAQRQYDEIIKQRDTLEGRLSNYGDLYTRDEDGKIQLANIKDQTKALEEYQKVLEQLEERGISKGLLDEVMNLGITDGTDLAKKLLSGSNLEKFNEAWELKQQASKQIAEKFYQDELDKLDEDFTSRLDEALAGIPEECTEVGINAIQGVIDGMNSQKGEAVATAKSIADAIVAELKRANDIHSPSKRMAREIGKPLTQGIVQGMQDAYDPQEMSMYADRMLQDVTTSQGRIAQTVASVNNHSAVSTTNVTSSSDLVVSVDKVVNSGNGSMETFLREMEFYRKQRANSNGGA